MVAIREMGIPHEKLNVHSGARFTATLLAALEVRGLKRGVASPCVGGGEATAVAVEMA